MRLSLKLVSLLVLLSSICFTGDLAMASASTLYPDTLQSITRQEFVMEMPKGYVSGIMILRRIEADKLCGSLVNEFGISMFDFTYDESRRKLKLESVIKNLDKWYIKRTLKSDLRKMLETMQSGETEYTNTRRKITYRFKPLQRTEIENNPGNENM